MVHVKIKILHSQRKKIKFAKKLKMKFLIFNFGKKILKILVMSEI